MTPASVLRGGNRGYTERRPVHYRTQSSRTTAMSYKTVLVAAISSMIVVMQTNTIRIHPAECFTAPNTVAGTLRQFSSGMTSFPTSRTMLPNPCSVLSSELVKSNSNSNNYQQRSVPHSQIRIPTPAPTLFSSSDDKQEGKITRTNRIDDALAKLTSAFPFFVLGAAILALICPSILQWTNRGDIITVMLSAVMWGTGLTLTKDDFTVVLKQNVSAVPAGVLCQFLIMPFSAYLIGTTVLSQAFVTSTAATATATKATQELGKAAFLGLCLVGCSPGGTASNLVSLIAKADVALSVLLTSCSTILASVVTPLLVKWLVGSTIAVSGWTLCIATARVVLLPVLFGMVVNAKAPNLSTSISRFTPFCSVLLVALICGGVVAENSSLLRASAGAASNSPPNLLPILVVSVLGLHCLGFLAGYLVPKFGLGFSEKTSRTISIETGMQNSALAVVLARSIGAPPIASLPGALSATAHSCLGSMLAAFWRGRDAAAAASSTAGKDGVSQAPSPGSAEDPDDYPELLI